MLNRFKKINVDITEILFDNFCYEK